MLGEREEGPQAAIPAESARLSSQRRSGLPAHGHGSADGHIQVTLCKEPVHREPLFALFGRICQLVIVANDITAAIVINRSVSSAIFGRPDRNAQRRDPRQDAIPAHFMLQRAQLGNDVFAFLHLFILTCTCTSTFRRGGQLVQLIREGRDDVGDNDRPSVFVSQTTRSRRWRKVDAPLDHSRVAHHISSDIMLRIPGLPRKQT